MTEAGRTGTWIENHLWQIIASGLLLYGGYLTGTTTTNHRLVELERRMDKAEGRLSGRSDFMVCAARQIDRLSDKVGVHLPCQLEVPE
jgi:hypothetical protein